VSAVRFLSTHINTLSASPDGAPPAIVVGPTAATGPASGQGHCLIFEKSVGCTSPISIHNRYISVRYSGIQKNDIYKKT
jgi:hypothetical protein